jgi:hypothetical protein
MQKQKAQTGIRFVKVLVRGHLSLWTADQRESVLRDEESRMHVEDAINRLRYNDHLIRSSENGGNRLT